MWAAGSGPPGLICSRPVSEPVAWVIVGVPHPDHPAHGVALVASNQLVRTVRLAPSSPLPGQPIALDMLMRSYLWVPGDTYADALRTLFAEWKPDDPPTPGPMQSIGPGW